LKKQKIKIYTGTPIVFYKKTLKSGDKVELVTHDIKNKLVFIKGWGWHSDNLVIEK
jgi:hypothetical protein